MLLLLLLTLTIPESARFVPLAKNSAIEISIVRNGDQPPWVTAVHNLPTKPEKVFELLSAFDQYEKIFSGSVKTAKILGADSNGTKMHVVWPLPFPMSNRDAIIRYASSKTAGKFQIDWVHDTVKDGPAEGLRIERVMGRTSIESDKKDGTTITYTYFGDLGGDLPDFIKEGSFKEEPVVYFNAVRAQLQLPPLPSL